MRISHRQCEKKPWREVVICAAGVISPWGEGLDSVAAGLKSARCALRLEEFEGSGSIPVGRIDGIARTVGEDRTITLMRRALEQIRGPLGNLSQRVPPERRGVASATSKGAVLRMTEEYATAHEWFLDFLPDAPARFLMKEIDAAGPSVGLVGACATALHNVFRGAEWIASDMADMVVAGSSEATLTAFYLCSFLNLKAMSREGCFPYDIRHSGMVAGEGAGLFVLSTPEFARAAGLPILAYIRGWATGAEAYHSTAMQPDGQQVVQIVEAALKAAACPISGIDMICSHGTATPQNDAAEAAGIRRLYKDSCQPPVFTTKGAIGHLMGATGAAELAACLVALSEQIAPATVGFARPADECRGLNLLTETRPHSARRMLKWNLGFGGHLAACVLEKDG